jgi:hypothetical protein
MNRIASGAIAGLAGALTMTGPIAVGQRLGLFRTAPPAEISRNAAEATRLPVAFRTASSRLWPVPHLVYGAGCGVLYSLIRRRLPHSVLAAGPLYGAAVWAVGYSGYLPVLQLYPSPPDDLHPRATTMIIAHLLFGLTVAALVQLREPAHPFHARALTGGCSTR